MPDSVNRRKSARIGDRQRQLARKTDGYKALVSIRRSKGFVSGDNAFITVQTTAIWVRGRWVTDRTGDEVTHWIPLPEEPPLADESNSV